MNRSLHKNLATLRELQAERKASYKRDLEEEIILARASDIKGLPYQAPALPTQNGFVFSNPEIFTAAHRLTVLKADPVQGAIRRGLLRRVIEPGAMVKTRRCLTF